MTNEGALFLVAVDLLCEQQSSATLVMALVSGERERERERERETEHSAFCHTNKKTGLPLDTT